VIRKRLGLIAAAALLVAPPSFSFAQDRDPAGRQALLDLAYVLGEAHALKQACEPNSQYWRARMERLIELEKPDQDFHKRLADRFNTGFTVREAQFPACNAAARAEAAAAARRGRALAQGLARIR